MKRTLVFWAAAIAACTVFFACAAAEAAPGLVISEACADNDFVWTLDFQDYLEIYNAGAAAVNLGDYQLQVGRKTAPLPHAVLAPGAYYVAVCDGKRLPALSKSGCAAAILDGAGRTVDAVILPESENQVWLREEGLSFVPSPGYPNTEKGAADWYRSVSGGLILSEALPGNFRAARKNGSLYADMLEIFNAGKTEIDLSDYFLSDDRKEPQKFQLPEVKLKAGGYYTFFCTEALDERHTGFKLSAGGERIYLSHKKQGIVDVLNVPPVTVDLSYGRKGGVPGYFAVPTLGKANDTLYSAVAERPVLSVPSRGDCKEPFTVEVTGQGPFYYTLDGSVPTAASRKYTKPIAIKDTAVLRVAALPEGAAPSLPVTAVYRFDTRKYTLPTVTVSVDPDYLTNQTDGLLLHVKDRELEVPAVITFLEADGALLFSQDCGLSIAGQTSRSLKNRGWKISFSHKYGKAALDCPVFEDGDAASFDSLVLRLGTSGIAIYDIMGTALGKDECPQVLCQRYRPVNLFIGSAYYGVYYLREHVNANFVANHLGGTEKQADIVYFAEETKAGSGEDWLSLVDFCRKNDLSVQKNYEFVEKQIDVMSFIDYFIWRPYTGDSDHPNIRYVRSRGGDRKWRIVIYDMDWAFQNKERKIGLDKYAYKLYDDQNHNNVVIYGLLQNAGFRQQFLERLSYHMQHTFAPDRVLGILDQLDQEVQHDLQASQKEWPSTVSGWNRAVLNIRLFVQSWNADRRTLLLQETQRFFGLTNEEMRQYFGKIRFR